MLKTWVMLLCVMSVVSACAVVPTAPNVMILPSVGKPFDLFQAEEAWCRS